MSRIELKIDGMSCEHCVASVTKALEAVEGVREVEVRLEPGGATVEGESLRLEALLAAVAGAGYEASVV